MRLILLFLLCATASFGQFTNARKLGGKPLCSSTVTTNCVPSTDGSGNQAIGTTVLGTPISTPIPDATKTQWYVKAGGAWCQQTPGAVETCIGSSGMVYPGAGIANSTGSAWGTSYTTTGSGTVVALATSPVFVTPALGTPSSGNMANLTGLTAGQIPAPALPTPGSTCTFTATSGYCVCITTCTIAVPVPAAGYQFCAVNDDNVSTAITLSAIGSSAMYENSARTAYGTAGTGTLVVAAAAANKVCLLGRDSTHYFTISASGTVTVN